MLHFSRLRLVGFKSFVEPAELIIDPGLTGVVGPNGCGKSNVVEALRWVMGETSARQLRGTDMDDVIFGGTTTRPPRNVAEVTISLDNREHTAPPQFDAAEELDITRRITRGEGSAYKVNGKEVRARDVQLLFADAATGARSTAMVSQGRVGALINAKPAQRRALLEEAAGIGGLHTRRHEAETRLRAAEGNLARLDDVLIALEGQMGGLRRQAKQAQAYRALSEQVQRAEAVVLRLRWVAALRAVDTARRALEAAQRAHAEATARTATATTLQADAALALEPARAAEAEAGARLQRLTLAREHLDAEDRALAQATAEHTTRLTQATADLGREQARLDDAAQALERLKEDLARLDDETADDPLAQAAAAERVDTATDAAETLADALARATTRLAEHKARRDALIRADAEARQRRDTTLARVTGARRERDEVAGTQIDPQELAAATEAEAQADEALDQARERQEEAEAARAEARAAAEHASEALRAAQNTLTSLEAEARGLAAILAPARRTDSRQGPSALETLPVPPGLEKALAGALGDASQAGLDPATASHWRPLPPLRLPPLPEGARALAEALKTPAALARRLNATGLVPDAATAERLHGQLAPGQRLVDPDGGVWTWEGLVQAPGSQDGAAAAAARLETRNRLLALEADTTAAQEQVDLAAHAEAEARLILEARTGAEQDTRHQVREAERALTQARERRAALDRAAASTAGRLSALAEALIRLEEDLQEAEARAEAAEDALDALGSDAPAEDEVARLNADLARARSVQVAAQADHDRLKRDADERARRRQALARDIQAWTAREADAQARLDELNARREGALAALADLEGRPDALAEQRDALLDALEEAEARRREASDALARSERALKDADKAQRDAERAEAQAREDEVRAEAALEQGQAEARAAAQAIAERRDCTPEALAAQADLPPDDTLPPITEAEELFHRLSRQRDAMGPVNLRADQELRELEEQVSTLTLERDDLIAAIARLRHGINELNKEGRARLLESFNKVDQHFQALFQRLFGGGRAHLTLIESDDPLEAGLEIMASPPGKRLQSLSLLSGGEQALTATALLFAVFLTNPAPICVLDEVDAPLDDANVDRFCSMLRTLTDTTRTRFLVVTHHRMTMARMDRLFGVTMAERGISSLVSVDLRHAADLAAQPGPTA
ncbi:chromosome segregation SMC family protein [Pararhodospirillum oryzae]|uniref:Chromosome partition protein Smc n=1 Tax=Pararhodospirillum oryzae TaxID=478448 RepID=A0A512H4H3_9PROT|nr:AAA family ATPase [Pararhodospirillum oryzae]GEO80364.1 chromosome partition protein Smc [Pararhodospirillum oryzae]